MAMLRYPELNFALYSILHGKLFFVDLQKSGNPGGYSPIEVLDQVVQRWVQVGTYPFQFKC